MKTVLNSFAFVAFAVTLVASCTEAKSSAPLAEGARTVLFTTPPIEVKTVFGEKQGGAYPVLWTANQETAIFYNSQSGDKTWNDGGQFVSPQPVESGLGAKLAATFTPEESSSHIFYAFSPFCALNGVWNEDWGDGAGTRKMLYGIVPADQNPQPGTCDEAAQLIAAKSEYSEFPDEVSLHFSHLSSYGKIESLTLPEGATDIVGVYMESNKFLSGEVYCDYSDLGQVNFNSKYTGNQNYIYLDVNNALRGTSLSDVFFATVPHTGDDKFGEGDWIKVIVYTTGDTWIKTINFSADRTLAFNPGRISSFSINADGFVSERKSGYSLVWSDEFNDGPQAGIDYAWPSDDWKFETGGSGWGNAESQYYVNKVHGDKVVSKVKDGSLVITAYKLDTPLNGMDYISARMTTKKSWTYGIIEMRAKLPAGRGLWPAFWMLPEVMTSDNLLDGEIDIMEYVGYEPGVVWFSVHNKKDRTEEGKNLLTTSYNPSSPESEFHVYGVEWTADYIKAYIDGTTYFTFENDGSGDPNSWPFFKAFNIKLNIAVGGSWGGYMGIDDSIFPAEYVIDYVRVYQK